MSKNSKNEAEARMRARFDMPYLDNEHRIGASRFKQLSATASLKAMRKQNTCTVS